MKQGVMMLAALCVFFCAGCGNHAALKKPFDANEWKKVDLPGTKGSHSVRAQMLDDLQARNDFQGWTREQVTALLGEPNGKLLNVAHAEYYEVGYIEGCNPFHEQQLIFTFDKNGKVVDAGIKPD